MNLAPFQKTLSRVLALGASGVTIFLVTGNVTDPVNAPKLFLLGGVAGASLALIVYLIAHRAFRVTGLEILVSTFLVWSLLALVVSSSPFSQGLYGVYGRNTGLLTYLFLGAIAVAATQLIGRAQFKYVLMGFLLALMVNLTYGLWVMLFGDFLGWQNNYGALLGTFGNPNFISSFLGMGFSIVLALAVKSSFRVRIVLVLALPLLAWELREADSLQGIVVAGLGTGIVTYFWIRHKTQSEMLAGSFLLTGAITAGVAVAGALGSGPLKQALAQPTVALREQYWLAAINMVKSNPLFGVGMDSYGDWYRRARGPQALITPGPDTVTNTAHNVFLDILAFGGYPLLILYVLLTILGAYSIFRVAIRSRSYDPIFVGIVVLWVGYQAQSIISINQIGLAVWGWLINGVVIAYEYNSRNSRDENSDNSAKSKNSKKRKVEIFSPQLISFLGAVVGLILAVPPMSADAKWRNVQISQQIDKVEPALRGGYMTPTSSYRLADAVQLLENSKLPQYAIKYARKGVKFNPDYFDAWRMLYYATESTLEEKTLAKNQMIRLDPLNPAWKKLN
jgi:O-antigen ligase